MIKDNSLELMPVTKWQMNLGNSATDKIIVAWWVLDFSIEWVVVVVVKVAHMGNCTKQPMSKVTQCT